MLGAHEQRSEIARLYRRLALNTKRPARPFSGLSYGTSQHDFITAPHGKYGTATHPASIHCGDVAIADDPRPTKQSLNWHRSFSAHSIITSSSSWTRILKKRRLVGESDFCSSLTSLKHDQSLLRCPCYIQRNSKQPSGYDI